MGMKHICPGITRIICKGVVKIAERRMISKSIIQSDMFLDMPLSAQMLYVHLTVEADDDGFVNSPKRIKRYIGASDDDMKLLIAKGYIIPFESGVIVITHWNVSNKVQKDRYKETICIAEKKRIHLNENKAYELISDGTNQLGSNMDTACNQNVSNLYTQYRLGEYRTEEDSKGKEKKEKEPLKRESYVSIIESYTSNFELQDSIKGYVEMRQKMKGFTVRALKMGLNKLDEIAGDDETKIAIVNQSIERSWKSFYPLSDSSKKEQDRFAGFAF